MLKTSNLAKFIRKESLDMPTLPKKILTERKLVSSPSSLSPTVVSLNCPNCSCNFYLTTTLPPEKKKEEITIPIVPEEGKEEKKEEGKEEKKEEIYSDYDESGNLKGLRKFNKLKLEEKCFSAAIVGTRRSGKTRLMTDLVNVQQYDDVLIFKGHNFPTELEAKLSVVLAQESWFIGLEGKNFIDAMEKIMDYQKLFPENKVLVFFDDMLHVERKTLQHPKVCKFFESTYPMNVSVLLSAQSVKSILPSMRPSFNLFFFFKEYNRTATKDIFDICGNTLLAKDFYGVLDHFTDNYGALVYHKHSTKGELYWYKV